MCYLKKIFIFLIYLQFSEAATHVFVQNNTTHSFDVNTVISSNPLSKSYWKQTNTIIKAGQRIEILQFNRDEGITNGKSFIFNTTLSSPKYTFVLQQKLRGALVNSHMWQSLKSSTFNHPWFDNRATHHAAYKSIKIRYRAFAAGTDDNIEYILDEDSSITYSADPNTLNILTYNVYMRPLPFQNGAEIRSSLIPSHLSGYDVIVFQELFRHDSRHNLLHKLKREYPYQTNVLESNGLKSNGGVVIISRWPIKRPKQKFFGCICEGADCLVNKGIQYALVNKKGKNYHIFGTHLEADYGDTTKHQLYIFKMFIDEINPPSDEPVLFAGDFNVNSEASGNNFKDLLMILQAVKPKHLGSLYSYEHSKNDLSGKDKGRSYYDHVLYSKNHANPTKATNEVKLIRAKEEWKEYIHEYARWDLSDHFPVHGHFQFNSKCVKVTKKHFAAIWRKTNKDTLIKRNYTRKKFYTLWTSMHSKGYHLEDFEFSNNMWHGVFKKGSGKYAMWRNYSHTGFDKKWREMNEKGFRLYDLETYIINGKRKWAGLFKKSHVKSALWTNRSTSDFAEKRQAMVRKGMKLIDLEVYSSNNQLKWSGVWTKGEDGLLNRNYDYDAFKNLVQKRSRNGYKLIDIENYCINGKQKWAGIWEKSTDKQHIVFDLNTNSFFPNQNTLSRVHEMYTNDGYELLDIENY